MDNIFVAMSGGVDSSISAYLLKQQFPNANIVGLTMYLGDFCTNAINNAKRICDWLGIKHQVVNLKDKFEAEIIQNFNSKISRNITPIPCTSCNRKFKFGYLMDLCQQHNAKFATGHYVKIKEVNGERCIFRAKDKLKDQTHFIYNIDKEVLPNVFFPLGDYLKAEIFRLANDIGLPYFNKVNNQYEESQNVCFIKGKYTDYIKERVAKQEAPGGEIRHITTNKHLGKHKGLLKYTVGQRQGLGIAWSEPLYVVKKDTANNILYVGEEPTLYTDSLRIAGVNFLVNQNAMLDSYNSFECDVCLLDKTPLIDAKIHVNGTHAEVHLNQPARAITPGQACKKKKGDVLLGGGEIK